MPKKAAIRCSIVAILYPLKPMVVAIFVATTLSKEALTLPLGDISRRSKVIPLFGGAGFMVSFAFLPE
jgi:hypothetical protein